MIMLRKTFLLFAAIFAGSVAAHAQTTAPGLLARIGDPEKAVVPRNPTLTGAWMLELRRPGQTVVTPGLVTFLAEGTCIGPTADGATSPAQGVWIRVTDSKFLQKMYIFNYDEKRVLTTISKVRITVQLSGDRLTSKGTAEAVLMDRNGNEMATIPGGSYTGVRLSAEKPADFEAFLLAR